MDEPTPSYPLHPESGTLSGIDTWNDMGEFQSNFASKQNHICLLIKSKSKVPPVWFYYITFREQNQFIAIGRSVAACEWGQWGGGLCMQRRLRRTQGDTGDTCILDTLCGYGLMAHIHVKTPAACFKYMCFILFYGNYASIKLLYMINYWHCGVEALPAGRNKKGPWKDTQDI